MDRGDGSGMRGRLAGGTSASEVKNLTWELCSPAGCLRDRHALLTSFNKRWDPARGPAHRIRLRDLASLCAGNLALIVPGCLRGFFVVASRHCVCIATMSPSRLRAARDGSARWGLIYGLTFALPSHGIDRLLRISIAGTIGGRWRLRETRVSAGTVSIISERSLLRTLIQAPGIVGGLLCVNSAGAAGRRRRLRTTRSKSR